MYGTHKFCADFISGAILQRIFTNGVGNSRPNSGCKTSFDSFDTDTYYFYFQPLIIEDFLMAMFAEICCYIYDF